MRGLSAQTGRGVSVIRVYPPVAGVIGNFCSRPGLFQRVSPGCGGYRGADLLFQRFFLCIPRLRGLSGAPNSPSYRFTVYPPVAGVIGDRSTPCYNQCGVSPGSGGYRALWLNSAERGACIPRFRGLSDALARLKCPFGVYPPVAGVIGGYCSGICSRHCVSPGCGGYRSLLTLCQRHPQCIPRLRGVSELGLEIEDGS